MPMQNAFIFVIYVFGAEKSVFDKVALGVILMAILAASSIVFFFFYVIALTPFYGDRPLSSVPLSKGRVGAAIWIACFAVIVTVITVAFDWVFSWVPYYTEDGDSYSSVIAVSIGTLSGMLLFLAGEQLHKELRYARYCVAIVSRLHDPEIKRKLSQAAESVLEGNLIKEEQPYSEEERAFWEALK